MSMQQYKIIGKAGDFFAEELAHKLGVAYSSFSIGTFADTESFITVQDADSLVGMHLVLVYQYSMGLVGDTVNNQLFNLLLVINRLKGYGATDIMLVLPYYPYSRHDKEGTEAHSTSAFILPLYQLAGATRIFTLDIHNEQLIQPDGCLESVSLANWWADHIRARFAEDYTEQQLVLVSPDTGGYRRVEHIASILGLPTAKILKKRTGANTSKALSLEGFVAGRHALIIDDIIDTGTTAHNAIELLINHGAVKVSACFSHGVFSRPDQAQQVIKQCCQVYYTDSLMRPSMHTEGIELGLSNFLAEQLKQRLATLLHNKG